MCRHRKPAQMQKPRGEAAWKRGCVHKGGWRLGGACVGMHEWGSRKGGHSGGVGKWGHALAPRTGTCIRQGDHGLTQRLRASATVLATTPEAIDRVSTLNPMRFPPRRMHVPTCTCPRFPAASPRCPLLRMPPASAAAARLPASPASQPPPTSGYERGNKASG
jgi:hypothetical protein